MEDHIDNLIKWLVETRTKPAYYLGVDGVYYDYTKYTSAFKPGEVRKGSTTGPYIINGEPVKQLEGLPESARPAKVVYKRPEIPLWIRNSEEYKEKYGDGEPDWFKEVYG